MIGRKIWFGALASLGLAVALALGARAQDLGPASELSIGRLAYIEPGTYLAGDRVTFELSDAGSNFLLRMQGSPEVFVLYVDRGSLGGRILKYDSGELALKVAGWGGMTLYTDSAPQGLPAVRVGDVLAPVPPSISIADMQSALSDDAERLAYVRRLDLQFNADWNALADNARLRGLAFDALENAARGIERFTTPPAARDAFARHVSVVVVQQGAKPTLWLNGRTLVVTFDPGEGYVGRASSRAIGRALERVIPR